MSAIKGVDCTVEPRFTGHPLNTESSLLRTVLFVPGKAHTFSLNSTDLIRTLVYTYNGHQFLAQSTDSHRKSTSLMRTLHYVLLAVIDFSFLKVKSPQLIACRCSQRYSTPHTMICRHQFQTILASNEL